MANSKQNVQAAYKLARERYAALGVDTDKVLKQLARVSGAKFDRIYVDEVVIKSCQADIANYERVGQEAEDPVLKAWVERQLPALRSHFAKAGKTLPAASPKGQRAV